MPSLSNHFLKSLNIIDAVGLLSALRYINDLIAGANKPLLYAKIDPVASTEPITKLLADRIDESGLSS